MPEKLKILFLCTGNSCRSQMAEAWTRHLKGDKFDVYSAGVQPKPVDPRAIKAMAEVGLDISWQKSKDVNSLGNLEFDYVITLCDNARESCPFFPGGRKPMHKGFQDPASFAGTEEEKVAVFRRVRDEIRDWIEKTFGK